MDQFYTFLNQKCIKKITLYVKKRSVLVEALNINSIDTIIGTYKGDKDTIIDQLAKLPPEELNQRILRIHTM
jgi:hypothetical protein